jgi:phosphatidate cytidylyltransferase
MSSDEGIAYLFTLSDAFADPFVRWTSISVVALLALAFVVATALHAAKKISPQLHRELITRTISWSWLIAIIGGAILLGRGAVIVAVALLSLLAYRDFARATGVFRFRLLSVVFTLGICALAIAAADRWHRMFFGTISIIVVALAMVTIPRDEPRGFVQRVGLAIMGFVLFGVAFGYISLLTEVPNYRALLLMLFVTVELNDIFGFIVGKTFKGPKLIPQTSPGKSISGSIGAIVLCTLVFALLGRFVFEGTPLGSWRSLITLGIAISIAGQFGDLLLSSIKRDVGIKDFAVTIPGHGGVLDRFDSLVFVPPVLYHTIAIVNGPLGEGATTRFFSSAFFP